MDNQIVAAVAKALGTLKRTGFSIGESRDAEGTAKAWAVALEPQIKEYGLDVLEAAVLSLSLTASRVSVTVADLSAEIRKAVAGQTSERLKNLQILAATERRIEEETAQAVKEWKRARSLRQTH